MAKVKVHAKKVSSKSSRTATTPQPNSEDPIIGSSCTWNDDQLDQFRVILHRDVDVIEMIPKQFFDFSNLGTYEKCRCSIIIGFLTFRQERNLCSFRS